MPEKLVSIISLRDQVAPAARRAFFALFALASTGLRAMTGAMRTGRCVRTAGAATRSCALKNARQPGLSKALLRIMQAVMRSMFGISEPQTRNASPLHACCCSGV